MRGAKQNPPWLMWGNSQVIDHTFLGNGSPEGGLPVDSPGQVITINYGRPETWRFLFVAKLQNVQTDSEIAQVEVFFDLMPGVGRVTSMIRGFEHYVFPAPLANDQMIWSTSVQGPLRNPDALDDSNIIQLFPAHSIQLAARALLIDFQANDTVQIEIAAHFSPNTHIRPEWFDGEFSGGEDVTL